MASSTLRLLLCIQVAIFIPLPSLVNSEIIPDTWTDIPKHENVIEDNQKKRSPEEEEEWSEWSAWSGCSRTCDGGVTYQLRKCIQRNGCRGNTMRYKICNMQPCPDTTDFRATQCSAYNSIAYRGNLYEWFPFYDPEDPCSLTCQAKDFNFVAKLALRVEDGTRCRDGSLDMCVAGKCLPVGCDLELGSTKKIDECGVCGGDGVSCKKPSYVWAETQFSPCSVTCGGGYQMSRPLCRRKDYPREVDERLCDLSLRPRPQIRECNTHKCPAVWITESWGPCTASCGGGRQSRTVYCAQGGPNGTRSRVSDSLCPRQKPLTDRPCNTQGCPRWFEGPWSGCSATCGFGYQTRTVICRDTRGYRSYECNNATIPATKQSCTTGIPCAEDLEAERGSQEDSPPHPFFSLPWVQKITSPASVTTEPSFVAGEWSACSVTCGEGIRRRQVDCKIFLEFSRTVAKLPDSECPGPRPPEVERCFLRPCALDQNVDQGDGMATGKVGIEVTYSWRTAGFTPCSASCLGGIRESVIQCVRDHDHAVISPYQCDINKKPDSITQTCNDHPCPPRWNVSDFSSCSKQCGGGLQTRDVQCVHELTRGTANILIVPNSACPQPPPRAQQFCNVFDCPTRWKTEPWSKCSKSCGGGVKTRKLKCQKELAFGQVVDQPPSRCPKKRPKTIKACNSKPCRKEKQLTAPKIYESPNSYMQKDPQRRVSLKVGGRAIVFKGTTLKIRCPSRRFNKTAIEWYKDHYRLQPNRKFQITQRGALRIRRITFPDSGTYICVAGSSKANISITVKPLPPGHGRSDEDRTVERPSVVKPIQRTVEEDYSHEHNTPEKDTERKHFASNKPPSSFRRPGKEKETVWGHERSHENTQSRPAKTRTNSVKDRDDSFEHPSISAEKPAGPIKPIDPLISAEASGGLQKPMDTWELQHGGPLFSDQESGELNYGTPHSGGSTGAGTEEPFGTTSSHALPHIQKLLSNLQKLGGTPKVIFPKDPQRMAEDAEEKDDTVEHDSAHHVVPINPASLMANSFVLGKGKAENLEFDWMITAWSPCSQTCGGNGFQVRASQCLVRLNNVSKSVDSTLCLDAGLQPPLTIQKCGAESCPHWEPGPWEDCAMSNCFTWNTALQERAVYCRLPNGTDVDPTKCDEQTRPRRKRECANEKCKGTWKVSEWSECTATCGSSGFQSRILQCVWFGTDQPAGNACRDKPRPPVMKPCQGFPCPDDDQCIDQSKYCSLAKSLNMCRMAHYRLQCCATCRLNS